MELIKKYLNVVLKFFCIFIVLIFIYTASLGITYLFPKNRIQKNIASSVDILKYEGQEYSPFYSSILSIRKATKLDNFTNSILLNVALDKEENVTIMERIVSNSYYQSNKNEQIINLEQSINKDTHINSKYIRYWFGSEVIIKFLLIFTDLSGIRYINMIVLCMLFIYTICLISKKIDVKYAIAFAMSIILMNFFIIPMSLQYSPVMYIALIATIAVIMLYNGKYKRKLPYMFFIIGSCTAFFDLLTFPLITLGYPLITLLLLKDKYDENNTVKDNIIYLIKTVIVWSIAYGITYVAKWAIASAVFGEDCFTRSLKQLAFRMNIDDQVKYSKMQVINKNLKCYFNRYSCTLIALMFICLLPIFIKKFDKTNIKLFSIIPLIMISVSPYIWYLVLSNHSYIHFWMTYRIQGIAVYGIFSAFLSTINMKNVKLLDK